MHLGSSTKRYGCLHVVRCVIFLIAIRTCAHCAGSVQEVISEDNGKVGGQQFEFIMSSASNSKPLCMPVA